jgi:ribosomal protein S27AE
MAPQHYQDYVIERLQRIILDPAQAVTIAQDTIAKLRGRTCPGCGVYFIAAHGNQRYHVRACSELARSKRYFELQIKRQEAALGEKGVREE